MDLNKAARLTSTSFSESTFLLENARRNEEILSQGTCLRSVKARVLIVVLFVVLAVLSITAGIVLGVFLTKNEAKSQPNVRTFSKAAVAAGSEVCSTVGVDILKKGGSAVDAAVASSFCEGVVNLQSTGIGGGGFMIYYNATDQSSVMIDFREVAASNITEEMMEIYKNDKDSTVKGGLAVMVPGQIKGLHQAWQRYRSRAVSWEDLLKPSIDLARNGFTVTKSVANAIQSVQETLQDDRFSELKSILTDGNKWLEEGDILRQTNLANTLEGVARDGPDYFYNSDFTEKIVEELQNDGSALTVEDFQTYEVKTREVVITKYDELSIHGTALPGGGAVLGLIFNILDGYNITNDSFNSNPLLAYHRMIEAFKFSYAQRLHLGDPDFNDTVKQVFEYMMDPSTAATMRSMITDNMTHNVSYYINDLLYNPPSHGTLHLSVYAENGDAVATTHTINTRFGSKLYSRTGVLFNNEMDDFSVPGRNNSFGYPPSPANYIAPKHRALSSMSPTIVLKNNKVLMVAGAAGGSRIPTATSQILLDILSFGKDLQAASPFPRLHHQLMPDELVYEPQFPSDIITGLSKIGHKTVQSSNGAIVQAIHVDEQGYVHAASDGRIGGVPDGY